VNVSEPLVQASLLGEAIDRGPVAVFVADDEMRFIAVNQYAADMLGYTREELLGLTAPDLVVEPDVLAHYAAAPGAGPKGGHELLRCKDGGRLEIDFLASETRVAGMTFYVGVAWRA
jgi:PAS domain S-box-containing protein